jgi:hypothetical protein
MRKKKSRFLAEFSAGRQVKENPSILRIIVSEEHIQMDFGYAAPSIYDRGGWIRISPDTFLQVHGSAKRYRLKEAKNISLAPEVVAFESTQDWCVFSLYFEPIPLKDCVLDMIEELQPSPNDFNYYGIRLSMGKGVELETSVEHS